MTIEEAVSAIIGKDLAESIIADNGIDWAVAAAMTEAKTTDDPEAISTIKFWVKERTEARAMTDAFEEFRSQLAALGAPAPWRLDDEEVGSILHAEGAAVITVDVNRELDDETVGLLCLAIITAVNTCAGLKAEMVSEDTP